MSPLVSACKGLSLLICLGAVPVLAGLPGFGSQGTEYAVVGALQGDQTFAQLDLNPFGGYLVWQDNATDGDGFGISARHINRSLSGSLGVFRVNDGGTGDQTLPQVAMLQNGGAAFVWQSALGGSVRVYARFLNTDGTFATGDVSVSSYTGGDQTTPVVASLKDGTVVVVWSSVGEEKYPTGDPVPNAMQGIFAQRFSQSGDKIGDEFQVNAGAPLNQRSPAIAALPNGNFIIAWVTEISRGVAFGANSNGATDAGAGAELFDVVLRGQIFDGNANPVGTELQLSSNALVCANPSLSGTSNGFVLAWSGRASQPITQTQQDDNWDIYARLFSLNGTPNQDEFRVNTYTYGDQYRPRTAFQDGIIFTLWTSLKQDGSWEGVVARLIIEAGAFISQEFRVNTTTIGKQVYPAITADGNHDFLAVWSSFVGGLNSFDLFAQRYTSTPGSNLAAPAAPYVSALSQTRLSATWPALDGYPGVTYAVYVDQNTTPVVTTNNSAVIVSLQPDTSHDVRLAYELPGGQQSPLSAAGTGKTWAEDTNFDGLPDDWQAKYWGPDSSKWPAANVDSDGDGATNLQELLAGTDPTDPTSVLQVRINNTSQGPRLEWNTEPGCLYQVQIQDGNSAWTSLGTPRFAAGKTDSIPVDAGQTVALYRVIRVR